MNNLNPIKAVRGMNDILPDQCHQWQWVQSKLIEVVNQYGYREIRYPIVESTQLFKRSVGEVTDIVEKEMYTFEDRNGDSLSLRPEGTAGCVRAGIENGILYNQQQRLWYQGPMFRHERPQRGRYRQFHQFGVEAFGFDSPDLDAELICMTKRFWDVLGLSQNVHLQLNTIGSPQSRLLYREKLVDYFSLHHAMLDEDSVRRLQMNPLRILDSKNPAMQELIQDAPQLIQHLDDDSKRHFDILCELLTLGDVAFTVNTRLVRGIDYYTKTVFEWVTDKLGAQGTVCAGGRYDFLVQELGGHSTPACGFGIGMERLLDLVDPELIPRETTDLIVLAISDTANRLGFRVVEELRSLYPNSRILFASGDSMKKILKRADKSDANIAIVIAENEVNENTVTMKSMRGQFEQRSIPMSEMKLFLDEYLIV